MNSLDEFVLPLVLMWVVLMLSAMGIGYLFDGWRIVAQHYKTAEVPLTDQSVSQTIFVNGIRYGMTKIKTNDEGVFMELSMMVGPGRSPIFIPWTEFHRASMKDSFLSKALVVEVGNPHVATIRLSPDIFEGSRAGRARLEQILDRTNVPP